MFGITWRWRVGSMAATFPQLGSLYGVLFTSLLVSFTVYLSISTILSFLCLCNIPPTPFHLFFMPLFRQLFLSNSYILSLPISIISSCIHSYLSFSIYFPSRSLISPIILLSLYLPVWTYTRLNLPDIGFTPYLISLVLFLSFCPSTVMRSCRTAQSPDKAQLNASMSGL